MGIFPFIFFPVWVVVFLALLAVMLFIFWIWAIIGCLGSKLSPVQKFFWVAVIFIFNIFGALLYFMFSSVSGEVAVRSKTIKGKKLLRSRKSRMIAGVCAGLGEYLDVDPTIIRLLWVLFTFFSFGAGILAYIIAWIIIPEK
jgi:phage shock protein C